jgi:ankyrin repeat protein
VYGHSPTSRNILIPETEENDAARRMKIIRSGTAEESLQEQLKLLFFQASNKSLFRDYEITNTRWPSMLKIIQLIDSAGLMRQPLNPGEDFTLLAAREELFHQTFKSMTWICERPKPNLHDFQGPLLDNDIKTITRFVKWLLLSGQDPDVPVGCCCEDLTSALQSALDCRLENLAGILLQHNADVHGRSPDSFYLRDHYRCWMHLPPLVLAIVSSSKSNNETLLSKFENHEELLEEFLSSTSQRPREFEDTYGPDKEQPLYGMMDRPNHEEETLFVFQYIKQKLGSAWFQKSEHNQGLLFHAARSGSLDLLDFVLENIRDINITNRSGSTALHNAVLARHSVHRTCSYLFKHKAILDCSTADMSAFHLACSQVDDVEVLRLLYSHGANIYKEIPFTPVATKWMLRGNFLPQSQALMELEWNSTPLKSVMNNQKLDRSELGRFLLNVAQNDNQVMEWMIDASLASANAEILLLALRADNWQTLRSNRWTGLLRTTMQCCDRFLGGRLHLGRCCKRLDRDARISMAHELLDYGVDIGPGDAVRAARLGDWDLVQQIWRLDLMGIASWSIPYQDGTISFLEATILWCPYHALETTHAFPYSPEALCAAAHGVCMDTVKLDVVEALLINRSFCDLSTIDTSIEMAAIGIALYNDRTQLLEILQKDLPAQSLARLAGITPYELEKNTSNPLWWHAPQRGSLSSFAFNLGIRKFLAAIQQYGWDTVCLSLLVQSSNCEKIELLMNNKMLRRVCIAAWESGEDEFPSPLTHSIREEDPKLVQACIHLGGCVNGDDPWSKKSTYTPLMDAIFCGSLTIVDLLLQFGADVNRAGRNYRGTGNPVAPFLQTPLLKACSLGYLAIAKRLIEHGADIGAMDDLGCTALEAAAARGMGDMIQLLLSEGEDVLGKNPDILDSAISKATRRGHIAAARLIKAQAEKVDLEYMDVHDGEDNDEESREDKDNSEEEGTGGDDVDGWAYFITFPE